jgi:hypothetical protein
MGVEDAGASDEDLVHVARPEMVMPGVAPQMVAKISVLAVIVTDSYLVL